MIDIKKWGLGLKVLTVLIIVMFVSVAVVCPVVRGDGSDAEANTKSSEPEIPDEVLNEYITDELDRISQMNEEQLMAEYGISMGEYQDAMGALAGSTVMLVGDEHGNVSVEVSQTVDRGRGGFWYEGNYFYFGIESVAWSAIKWWFSDDCINMLVDQICQNNIDVLSIAQNELNSASASLQAIVNDIVNIGNTIKDLENDLRNLNTKMDDLSNDAVAYADSVIVCAEDQKELLEEAYELNERLAQYQATFISRASQISAEDIAEAMENNGGDVNDGRNYEEEFNDYLSVSERYVTIYCLIYGIDIDIFPKFFGYKDLTVSILTGNTEGAIQAICEGLAEQAEGIAEMYIKGELQSIIDELKDTKARFDAEKKSIGDEIDGLKKSIEHAKQSKKVAKESKSTLKAENKSLQNELQIAKVEEAEAEELFKDSLSKYEDEIDSLNEARTKCNNGEISFEEFKAEKAKFDAAQKDLWDKNNTLFNKRSKSDSIYKLILNNELEINNCDLEKRNQAEKIKANKVKELTGKVDTLKTDLKIAKAGAKAGAKAAAKAGAKALISATGIGSVIMIAVDIVMALLIKFIEDHISQQGDVYEDYGIIVKVQVTETYTVHQTIRVLWSSYTIHFEVTAPCIPRLDGVYKQW